MERRSVAQYAVVGLSLLPFALQLLGWVRTPLGGGWCGALSGGYLDVFSAQVWYSQLLIGGLALQVAYAFLMLVLLNLPDEEGAIEYARLEPASPQTAGRGSPLDMGGSGSRLSLGGSGSRLSSGVSGSRLSSGVSGSRLEQLKRSLYTAGIGLNFVILMVFLMTRLTGLPLPSSLGVLWGEAAPLDPLSGLMALSSLLATAVLLHLLRNPAAPGRA
ncbi:hypothetical protein [Calidithermus chliarophilus]|uniref:hypothetical protein n=1 Tax=Calidithermus chliarophilus TaxID=52023 RepID=UPI000685C884|nr:hypothetical protein [Calidithermus chliarophilus]